MTPILGSLAPRDLQWIYSVARARRGGIDLAQAQNWRSSLFKVSPEELLDQAREDNEHEASFCMLASMEALMRIDFGARRDPSILNDGLLTPRFAALAAASPNGFVRTRDIVEAWQTGAKTVAGYNDLVADLGHFRGMLRFRNWFAHGRSWLAVITVPCDAISTYNLSKRLLLGLTAFRADFSTAISKVWPS